MYLNTLSPERSFSILSVRNSSRLKHPAVAFIPFHPPISTANLYMHEDIDNMNRRAMDDRPIDPEFWTEFIMADILDDIGTKNFRTKRNIKVRTDGHCSNPEQVRRDQLFDIALGSGLHTSARVEKEHYLRFKME